MSTTTVPTIVIDNGTGFTKMGHAGNQEPCYYFPTVIADPLQKSTVSISKLKNEQLDFYIGNEALQNNKTHNIIYPLEQGIVQNWELMEKFWHRSIFDYLRCDPENYVFILTEPPLNPPENREKMAEIFFETFNVKGLYIGVQAVLALISNSFCLDSEHPNLSGVVVDSGDGSTTIIPISDGYVIGSCIKHVPLAGRDMTKFIMEMLRDRKEPILAEDLIPVAKQIKEKYSYITSGNLVQEFEKFDADPTKRYKKLEYTSVVNGQKNTIDVGYEQFLAPEMMFKPEFVDKRYKIAVDEQIDKAIQSCPIDTRRKLYENIVLSGGSTLIKNFNKRLKKNLQKAVNSRLKKYEQASGVKSQSMKVEVSDNPYKQFSVWQGASILATQPQFPTAYKTREEYMEYGPSIARYNAVFSMGM